MFFYQDYSSWIYKHYGNPYETYIRIKTEIDAYNVLKQFDGKGVLKVPKVSKTKDDYDFIGCTALDFNILDTNGNILFKCDNITIENSKFVKKIEKVPQNVMKVIDSGEYSIEPIALTYLSGYLSTNPTEAEIKELQRKKTAVPTIETIKDINLNNFYDKFYKNIRVTAEENYKKYSNGKYSKEFLLDSLMFPLTETKYEFLATRETDGFRRLLNEENGISGPSAFGYVAGMESFFDYYYGYDIYYRNYSPQKRIIFKTRERMYDIRNEVEKINDKELRIEKLMQSLPQTNLDIMITPVDYKVFGLSSSDPKEKICNSLSETTGLEIVYKQNPDNTFEKNINANGYRIAEIDELKKAKDYGLIEWNEKSMELYVVRKHNSIPELEERIQKAEEERKRLEAEEDRKNGILRIPEGTKAITSTNLKEFWNSDSIKEINYIVIPDSVTSIGEGAFMGCTSLEEITIPDSVTSIEDWALKNCTSLKVITIPDSVTSIDEGAFMGCYSLKEITIPDSVTSIGEGAFMDCTSLKVITIPNSVTLIGEYAFSNCTSLEEITIPDSVTSIGVHAFSDCHSLEEITIPNSVTLIEDYAFFFCVSLKRIYIPDSITSIDDFAFSYCTSLEEITIPDSVTVIDGQAFMDCTSLKEITIPNSVTSIGNYVFEDSNSLKKIRIPKKFKDNNGFKDFINNNKEIINYY